MSVTGGCTALLVSAGRGHRFGGETPKQYLDVGGVPLLRTCAERFLKHPDIDAVTVVIHPDDRGLYDNTVEGLGLTEPVHGGAERQEKMRSKTFRYGKLEVESRKFGRAKSKI